MSEPRVPEPGPGWDIPSSDGRIYALDDLGGGRYLLNDSERGIQADFDWVVILHENRSRVVPRVFVRGNGVQPFSAVIVRTIDAKAMHLDAGMFVLAAADDSANVWVSHQPAFSSDLFGVGENLAEASGLELMKWIKQRQQSLDHYEIKDGRFFALA